MYLRGPFRFDVTRHRYTVGTTVVPGVHGVLRAGGLEPSGPWFTPEHRARGLAIHRTTLISDLGEPQAGASLPLLWQPFHQAYLDFREDVPCRWRLMEHPKLHRRLGYATILDRVGIVSGRPAVVEIKTGGPAPFHGPQLAGADILLSPQIRIGLRRRLAVYLYADGSYQLKEYTDSGDYYKFLTAAQSYWQTEDEDSPYAESEQWLAE